MLEETSKAESSGLDSSSSECSSSTNVSDCRRCANPCPLYLAVLLHGNLERLEIDGEAETEPSWLHNNDPILLLSAVEDNNLEAVCAMLYCGANFNDSNGMDNPFNKALSSCYREIADVLFNFYYHDLYLVKSHSIGASISLIDFLVTCKISDYSLFKLWFGRIDRSDAYCMNYLLLKFVRCKCTSWNTSDWLECIYLILNSVTEPMPYLYTESISGILYYPFIHHLMKMFKEKNVQQEDRFKIINICLSFGLTVGVWHCNCIYELYGFVDELEVLIYSGCFIHHKPDFFYIIDIILSITANPDRSKFERKVDDMPFMIGSFWIAKSLWKEQLLGLYRGRYFLSVKNKEFIKAKLNRFRTRSDINHMLEELERIPTFPSLLELCRNQLREILTSSNRFPYQFQDRVKQLELPCILKDVIRLKAPIYP